MKGLKATTTTLQKEHRRVVKLIERGSLDIDANGARSDLHQLLEALLKAYNFAQHCRQYEKLGGSSEGYS